MGFYMKKIFISSLLVLSFFLSLLASCKFEDESETLSAPSVDNTSTTAKGITVARERLNSSTESVLVYRINVDDPKAKEVHIGTLYPKILAEELLIFNDQMVHSSKTYKYRYVYVDSDSKRYYTEWSTALKVTDGQPAEKSLVYTVPSTVYFEYSPSDYTLKLTNAGDIKFNEQQESWLEKYNMSIVLRTSSNQLSFPLTEKMQDPSAPDPLSLKAIIPTNWYDTKIYVSGIVGRNEDKNKDSKVERVYWTELSPVTVKIIIRDETDPSIIKSETDITERGFTVPSVTSDGGIIY